MVYSMAPIDTPANHPVLQIVALCTASPANIVPLASEPDSGSSLRALASAREASAGRLMQQQVPDIVLPLSTRVTGTVVLNQYVYYTVRTAGVCRCTRGVCTALHVPCHR